MKASVIIPSYNRYFKLVRCLKLLSNQSLPPDQYEIVVVDDGSTDDTRHIEDQVFTFRLICHHQANQGSAAARNAGVGISKGRILIFLDDDICVEPGFVAGIIQGHESFDRTIVMGTFRPLMMPQARLFQRILIGYPAGDMGGNESSLASFTEVTSNNISIKRADFFSLGMWQDVAGDGQTLWGDVDFAYRAYKQGFAFRRALNAVCYHDDYAVRDLATSSRRAEIAAQCSVLLFERYPELIDYLPMFRDKTPVIWGQDSFSLLCRKLMRRTASSQWFVGLMEVTVHYLEQYHPYPDLLRRLYRWIIGGYIFRGYREGLRLYEGKS